MLWGISQAQEKPKLVVGIVVDQMRYDYVYRFWNQFGNNGHKLSPEPTSVIKAFEEVRPFKSYIF